ncbi:MAG: hypothetical protein U0K57_05870 [Lachnospiraceae bacterium]|nr:hypothetical protein [Lachnospiraceae bacterium]
MGRKDYIIHYFNFKNALPFFLVSFLGLVVVLAILFIAARVQTLRWNSGLMANPGSRRRRRVNAPQLIESFYEMVFSTTSVLFFLSLYYIIDARIAAFATYWTKYQDVLLLVFILLSVFLTNWFDSVLVKLTNIKEEKKASIRLTSSLYIVLILLYIRFIYDDLNYNTLILYFITLAAGRFLYFDFTWKDFFSTVGGVVECLPLLALVGIYSAITCWYGFHVEFLLKSNGVIVSTLIAHLFMDLSILVLHHTRLLHVLMPVIQDSVLTAPAAEVNDNPNPDTPQEPVVGTVPDSYGAGKVPRPGKRVKEEEKKKDTGRITSRKDFLEHGRF